VTSRETVLGSLLVVVTATGFWLGAKAFGRPSPPSPAPSGGVAAQYDPTESASKLRRIGHALRLYRDEHGSLPVPMRRTLADAGLPPSPATLAMPGHAWSLRKEDFKLDAMGEEPLPRSFSSFQYAVADLEQNWAEILPLTGDRQIFAVDDRFFPESRRDEPVWQALVLRIDGSVEAVEYPKYGWNELVRK
jgi:hypothetical protein